MHKKMRKSPAAILLLAVALTAILGGCSDKSGSDSGSGNGSAEASKGAEASKPAEAVTLQVFSMPSNTSGLQQGWYADILRDKAGVNLELLPAGDHGEQKLQALMAGGELPDIVVFKTKRQVEDAVRAGMLINLDDHIDKLPNVAKNAPTALQYYRDAASNGSGKAFAIPNQVGPSEVGATINYGPFIRWDLYKKLGLPQIKDLEDYLPVLKQMQDLEPKNKDGQKVYAFTLWQDWDYIQMMLAAQPSNFMGIDTGDQLDASLPFMQVDVASGETKSVLDRDSQYIRSLRFYYEANQMGLIDPDSLTQRWDTAVEKMNQGRVLFSVWPWYNNNKKELVDADPPTGFEFVPFDSYKGTWFGDNPIGNTWAFAISASTKHLDAALKYIDFMYSTDGLQLLMNGPKGVVWDMNEQGEPYITDQGWDRIENGKELPGGGTLSSAVNAVNAQGLSGAVVNPETNAPLNYTLWPTTISRNPSKLTQDWQSTTGFKTQTEMLKAKNMYTLSTLAMKLVPTMPEEINAKVSRIADIVKTNSWLAVFAKNDEDFEKFVGEMASKAEGLGLQEVLEWDAAAWKQAQGDADRYK
ncbi:extracellular solute-binding protein [Cohnella cellulosilytica]|uniref:Extracellular solute-binding protein n=1 Tax=Cohnella cellulosilytica TaxID=986710 RepID=A0ABW2FJM3_9BACL